jgi:hypothetical protein
LCSTPLNAGVLEPLELERWIFKQLRFFHLLARVPNAARTLATPEMVSLMVIVLLPPSTPKWELGTAVAAVAAGGLLPHRLTGCLIVTDAAAGGDVSQWSPRCRRMALSILALLCPLMPPEAAKEAVQEVRRPCCTLVTSFLRRHLTVVWCSIVSDPVRSCRVLPRRVVCRVVWHTRAAVPRFGVCCLCPPMRRKR